MKIYKTILTLLIGVLLAFISIKFNIDYTFIAVSFMTGVIYSFLFDIYDERD
jgi:hypothetical protein